MSNGGTGARVLRLAGVLCAAALATALWCTVPHAQAQELQETSSSSAVAQASNQVIDAGKASAGAAVSPETADATTSGPAVSSSDMADTTVDTTNTAVVEEGSANPSDACTEKETDLVGSSDASAGSDKTKASESTLVADTEKSSEASAGDSSEGTARNEEGSSALAAANGPESAETGSDDYASTHANLYRLYNPYTGEHLYTMSLYEAQSIVAVGWQWEGIGWTAPVTSDIPVYRLYNPYAGDHFYTQSGYERDYLVTVGWRSEGIGWYSDASDQSPVLREYNPYASAGTHNYTLSAFEDEHLGNVGWHREGTAFYASTGGIVPITPFWLVTASWTNSLERYWVQSDGSIAVSRVIYASEGSGYDAYATGSGAVVRGKYDDGAGHVYVANNDGALAERADGASGWLDTSAYDGGNQRYWYDADSRAMRTGLFTVDGVGYYGVPGQGYILRGKASYADHVLLADGNGHLIGAEVAPGWLVTGAYDGGALQRYWLEYVTGTYLGAKTGFFTVEGVNYIGLPDEGYVLRNDYYPANSMVYYGNNDGALREVCYTCCDDVAVNRAVARIVDSNGWFGGRDLYGAFSYVAGFPYYSGSVCPEGDWAPGFALEMINNGGGNCYRYAALFCMLARSLGYSANAMSGWVWGYSGNQAPHGWTEVYVDGTTYVCDSDMAHEMNYLNWYMQTYDSAPTEYFFW